VASLGGSAAAFIARQAVRRVSRHIWPTDRPNGQRGQVSPARTATGRYSSTPALGRVDFCYYRPPSKFTLRVVTRRAYGVQHVWCGAESRAWLMDN